MEIINADSAFALDLLDDSSVHAVVTDPPAGIGFMGKDWDKDKGGRDAWVAWLREIMVECLRVLKPGGYAVVWALPRTSHWTATAIEDAGFEVRDVLTHHFGTGFPKSLDVGKAIDKAAGAERKSVPATEEARQWDGWGTALKPGSEHWILARKPLDGTVAANVLEHGTGAINVDACRIGSTVETWPASRSGGGGYMMRHRPEGKGETEQTGEAPPGRWPTNAAFSGDAVEELDQQSGIKKAGTAVQRHGGGQAIFGGIAGTAGSGQERADQTYGDVGGASRFFYCPKTSKRERGEGNDHPTVKPQALMRWLVRLVTPPGGTVLDPFMGSGSTGVACVAEGFDFIGIELDSHYCDVARSRIERAMVDED